MRSPAPRRAQRRIRPVNIAAADTAVRRGAGRRHSICSLDTRSAGYPSRFTERLVPLGGSRAPIAPSWRNGRLRAVAHAHLRRDARGGPARRPGASSSGGSPPSGRSSILSGNSIEHALLAPRRRCTRACSYAPLAPAYSLQAREYGTLRHIFEPPRARPGVRRRGRFVRAGARAPSCRAGRGARRVVLGARGRRATSFDGARRRPSPTAAVDDAHARVGPDTIAKILYTSGSTGPAQGRRQHAAHAVLQPGRCSEPCSRIPGGGAAGAVRLAALEPHRRRQPQLRPRALERRHALHRRGPPAAGRSSRRRSATCARSPRRHTSRCRAPTRCCSRYLRADRAAARAVLRPAQDLLLRGRGAHASACSTSSRRWRSRLAARRSSGSRAWAPPETAPFTLCTSRAGCLAGFLGFPVAGPRAQARARRREARGARRGPNVTPGYWRDDALTSAAFDAEGFYRLGDAMRFLTPTIPRRGLVFDGRLAEDFKLSTGPGSASASLRARDSSRIGAGYVQDAVIAGHDRAFVPALLFPNLPMCRALGPISDPKLPRGRYSTIRVSYAVFRAALEGARRREHRHLDPCGAGLDTRCAAVHRCPRGDRQGLAQPERPCSTTGPSASPSSAPSRPLLM